MDTNRSQDRRIAVRLIVLLPALCALLVVPRLSEACSCGGPTPPTFQAFEYADAVFVAVVTGRTTYEWSWSDETRHSGGSSLRDTEATLQIEEIFKGLTVRSLVVPQRSCQFSFAKGQRYLVYARREADEMMAASVCSRTRLLSDASSDLEWLRAGRDRDRQATLYGELFQYRDARLFLPAAGTRVLLQGPDGTRTVRIGPATEFEFNDLPDGNYTLSVEGAAIESILLAARAGPSRPSGPQIAVRDGNPVRMLVVVK